MNSVVQRDGLGLEEDSHSLLEVQAPVAILRLHLNLLELPISPQLKADWHGQLTEGLTSHGGMSRKTNIAPVGLNIRQGFLRLLQEGNVKLLSNRHIPVRWKIEMI